jgi:hypothetical protein
LIEKYGWVFHYRGHDGNRKMYEDAGRLECHLRKHEVDALTMAEFWGSYMFPAIRDEVRKKHGGGDVADVGKDLVIKDAGVLEAIRRINAGQ